MVIITTITIITIVIMVDSSLAYSQDSQNLRLKNQYNSDSFTRRYELLLSPCYQAPEEFTQTSLTGEAMKKADVFRLGCIVYELFTFKPLFTRLSLARYVGEKILPELEALPEPVKVWNDDDDDDDDWQ